MVTGFFWAEQKCHHIHHNLPVTAIHHLTHDPRPPRPAVLCKAVVPVLSVADQGMSQRLRQMRTDLVPSPGADAHQQQAEGCVAGLAAAMGGSTVLGMVDTAEAMEV